MAKFISKEKFSKTVQEKKEAEKTTPWLDLDKEEIYKIVLIEKKQRNPNQEKVRILCHSVKKYYIWIKQRETDTT